MCESELEKRLDELLDELLQTKDETKKSALRKKIEPIFEELNRDDRPKKCDPFWLTDNCDTISCLEIDMKHDRSGRVKGWMDAGPISDFMDEKGRIVCPKCGEFIDPTVNDREEYMIVELNEHLPLYVLIEHKCLQRIKVMLPQEG
ncbi:MAG: hypothetical protein ABSD92_04610 [Candidatus Bathyarchaeia archaeon]|jgi:hypothetical protein